MRLKGSKLLYVKARMAQAKELGREEMPVRVRLYLSPETDFDSVKSDLGNYQAKVVDISPSGEKIKLGDEILTIVEVPAKNLRKVIEQEYVKNYEWPVYLELLAGKPRYPSLGFPTGLKAPDTIEVLPNVKPPTEDQIIDLTSD